MPERKLLIVWHSRTGAAHQAARAARQGALQTLWALDCAQVTVALVAAARCQAEMLREAHAYLFIAPENLGTLSGTMKEFFDRTYYDALEHLNGRPYALAITAGSDGQGAARQAQRICTGWRLRLVAEPLILRTAAQTPEAILAPKRLSRQAVQDCATLGGTLAALLD